MKFKVHWIIDGIAEIEGESKEDAEKKTSGILGGICKKF